MVLKITLHKGTLMLKKNIILAFLLFNLLNYSSQLFAGAGEGIAAMVGHNDYSTWNNDHKLAFRDDDGEIAAGHPLQNTELHDQQNHDPSCSQSVVFPSTLFLIPVFCMVWRREIQTRKIGLLQTLLPLSLLLVTVY